MSELDKDKKSAITVVYEGIMFLLAFIAVATIWYETKYDQYIVWGTWTVFFIDFLFRFITTNEKWQFLKNNPFIVIAIIPFDAIFQLARVARFLHFLRLKTMAKYYAKPMMNIIENKRMSKVIPLGFIIVFMSIIPLYLLEPNINSYDEAFIGSLASLVYFGYSKVNPQTTIGVAIITLLTILGLMMQGIFISYLFKFIQNLHIAKSLQEKRGGKKNFPL